MKTIIQDINSALSRISEHEYILQSRIKELETEINVRIQREQHLRNYIAMRIVLIATGCERTPPELEVKIAKQMLADLDTKRDLRLV